MVDEPIERVYERVQYIPVETQIVHYPERDNYVPAQTKVRTEYVGVVPNGTVVTGTSGAGKTQSIGYQQGGYVNSGSRAGNSATYVASGSGVGGGYANGYNQQVSYGPTTTQQVSYGPTTTQQVSYTPTQTYSTQQVSYNQTGYPVSGGQYVSGGSGVGGYVTGGSGVRGGYVTGGSGVRQATNNTTYVSSGSNLKQASYDTSTGYYGQY